MHSGKTLPIWSLCFVALLTLCACDGLFADLDTLEPTMDAGGDAAGQDDVTCDDDRKLCGSSCVDITSNPDHCGDCDEQCLAPENGSRICVASACDVRCDDEFFACGLECVQFDRNDDHCGECHNSCEGEKFCVSGRCRQSCETPSDCEETPDNAIPLCHNELCSFECLEGFEDCNGECVDTTTDVHHCGTCNTVCTDVHCLDGGCSDCDPTGEPFGGGDGSFDNPFQICSEDQLRRLSAGSLEAIPDATPSSYYELHADIDLRDEPFTPTNTFEGSFDGLGATIMNVRIEESVDSYIGFFSRLSETGELRNLHLESVTIDASSLELDEADHAVGGLVGRVDGQLLSGGIIENVSIYDIAISGPSYVGGLVGNSRGFLEDVKVTGLTMTATAQGESSRAVFGGLAGVHRTGTISLAEARGIITGNGDDPVTLDSTVGGLVGSLLDTGTVQDSMAAVVVSADQAEFVGGLVGRNRGQVRRSYSSGEVVGSSLVGGLVGQQLGSQTSTEDSYSTAAVTGAGFVGGLIGAHGTNSGGSISTSYSSGPVTGDDPDWAGGLVGTACFFNFGQLYWDGDTAGVPSPWNKSCEEDQICSVPGLGDVNCPDSPVERTTAEFAEQNESLFEGFDFGTDEDNPWKFGLAPDGVVRPILYWQDE